MWWSGMEPNEYNEDNSTDCGLKYCRPCNSKYFKILPIHVGPSKTTLLVIYDMKPPT